MPPRCPLLQLVAAKFVTDPDPNVALFPRRAFVSVLIGATLVVGSAGCGGGASGAPDGATTTGVWPADATKMVAEDHGGGFTGPAPAGSTCPTLRLGTYTLTTADKRLAWHICQVMPAGALYQFVDGARTLTDAELAAMVAALRGISISTRTICGADKENLTLTVTTPTGDSQYLDSFYICLHQGVYVDGIDGIFEVSRSLTN